MKLNDFVSHTEIAASSHRFAKPVSLSSWEKKKRNKNLNTSNSAETHIGYTVDSGAISNTTWVFLSYSSGPLFKTHHANVIILSDTGVLLCHNP